MLNDEIQTEIIELQRWAPLGYMASPIKLHIALVKEDIDIGVPRFHLFNLDSSCLGWLKTNKSVNECEWRLFEDKERSIFIKILLSELEEYGGFDLFKENLLKRWKEIENAG